MVLIELLALGKVQGQGLIDIYRRKVTTLRFPRHGENIDQEWAEATGL